MALILRMRWVQRRDECEGFLEVAIAVWGLLLVLQRLRRGRHKEATIVAGTRSTKVFLLAVAREDIAGVEDLLTFRHRDYACATLFRTQIQICLCCRELRVGGTKVALEDKVGANYKSGCKLNEQSKNKAELLG